MSDNTPKAQGDGVPEPIEGRAESEALIVNPLLGKLLNDRFRVDKKIGEGGFGAVYRGTDTVTGRLVAIKFLLQMIGKRARQALARFQREAAITGRLNHPFVITIYDSGIHEACPYIVMEWIQGETLSDRLKKGPIDWRALITILRDVSSALAHAAAQGVVHRDMKPDNIMIRESTGTAVVLDFGIAATYEQNEDGLSVTRKDRVTSLGLVMGTPDFIPPESWAGEKALDGRADVYALGAMIYQALEGRSMWGIAPSGANDFPAFKRLAENALLKPRPPITAPVPDGIKVLYSLATVADRNDRPWPEGFYKACEELLATNGTSITLDHRSRTLAARILGDNALTPQPPEAKTVSVSPPIVAAPTQVQTPVGGVTRTPVETVFRRSSLLIGGLIAVVLLSAGIAGAIVWAFNRSATATSPSVAEPASAYPVGKQPDHETDALRAPAPEPGSARSVANETPPRDRTGIGAPHADGVPSKTFTKRVSSTKRRESKRERPAVDSDSMADPFQ